MRKERKNIGIDRIQLNTGQLDWLPRNPRTWTQDDIDRTAASIEEDPDFLEERPILVVPFGKEYVAFGGNLRHEGCAKRGRKTAPCVVYYPESEEDYETVKRRAMKDNGSFGKWDWDTLANEWDDEPLPDWGVPAWPEESAEDENSAEDKNSAEDEGMEVPPDALGESFSLPEGEKSPFRQVSFQLSDEMAGVLLLATKAAQYSDAYYELVGDEEDVNGNGVAAYLLAREWCDKNLNLFNEEDYERVKKEVESLRQYLRNALEESGKKAVDVDTLLGTSGMAGHYFGASQWMFPTRKAYEKMRQIMPLPRDYYECKKIEMQFNLLETLQGYKKNGQS